MQHLANSNELFLVEFMFSFLLSSDMNCLIIVNAFVRFRFKIFNIEDIEYSESIQGKGVEYGGPVS